MTKYLLIAGALCFASPGRAGIESVGKGGGYAEMQAVWINLNLETLTRACTMAPERCGLSAPEAARLASAAQGAFDLELSPACEAETIQVFNADSARLASCVLYFPPPQGSAGSPQVKSFKDIAAWVLGVRLMARTAASFGDAFLLANRVLSDATQDDVQAVLSLDHFEAVFHDLTLRYANGEDRLISIEGRTKTFEITDLIRQALACDGGASPENWRLEPAGTMNLGSKTGGPVIDQGLLEMNATWSCAEGPEWRARLRIFVALQNGEVVGPDLRVRLTGKHR